MQRNLQMLETTEVIERDFFEMHWFEVITDFLGFGVKGMFGIQPHPVRQDVVD